MSKIFFTSDTHFGHENIIKFAKRPFSSVEEMDKTLVSNWNRKVAPEDTVYHLGDFSFHGGDSHFSQLNGKKHLIIGNHDRHNVLNLKWASRPSHYKELQILKEGALYGVKIILFHYPIEEWNGHFNQRSIHFYGHVHGKTLEANSSFRFDLGVECWNYEPVTLDEILDKKGINHVCNFK